MILLLIMLVGCSNTIVKDDINNGLEDELVPSTELYWGIKDNALYISAEETENAIKVNSSVLNSKRAEDIPWYPYPDEKYPYTINKVVIEESREKIVPISMNRWFCNMYDCEYIFGLNNIDTSLVTDMCSLFYDCYKLKFLHIDSFNTCEVINMDEMFTGCASLKELYLSSFDTSKVENMGNMFSHVNLESLDLSTFDTSNVKNMSAMFTGSIINNLNLSSFDTSNVKDMQAMFAYFETDFLDLSSFDTSNVEDMSFMFNWSRINKLDVSSFNTSNAKRFYAMFGSQFDYFQLDNNLKDIDISHFDFSNAQDINDISDLYSYTH